MITYTLLESRHRSIVLYWTKHPGLPACGERVPALLTAQAYTAIDVVPEVA